MLTIILHSKRLSRTLRKQLKAGQLDEMSVVRLADGLVREYEADQQVEELRNKRLKIIFPILFVLVALILFLPIQQLEIPLEIHLMLSMAIMLLFVLIVVGLFFLFRWLDYRYLRDFVNATRKHYPAISARYADYFFTKKQK